MLHRSPVASGIKPADRPKAQRPKLARIVLLGKDSAAAANLFGRVNDEHKILVKIRSSKDEIVGKHSLKLFERCPHLL